MRECCLFPAGLAPHLLIVYIYSGRQVRIPFASVIELHITVQTSPVHFRLAV